MITRINWHEIETVIWYYANRAVSNINYEQFVHQEWLCICVRNTEICIKAYQPTLMQ